MPNSRLNVLATAVTVLTLCTLLAATARVNAQTVALSQHVTRCSNATLFGDYGSSAEGVLLPAPGVSLEFRGLTVTHFDGRGGLTWNEHTVINGEPAEPGWVKATGTYTVNPDCSGRMVVITPNAPEPLDLAIVVVNHGREMHSVLDAHAILSVFKKID